MELKDYWRIFRAHWIAIIAITLAGGLIGIGWAFIQPKVYAATASGILTTGVSTDIGTATVGENYAKSRVKSYIDMAKSTTVAQLAAEELGISTKPTELLEHISVTNPVDTATLKVTAEAGTAANARDLAEAWVGAIGVQVEAIENANANPEDPAAKSIVTFRSLDSALLPSERV